MKRNIFDLKPYRNLVYGLFIVMNCISCEDTVDIQEYGIITGSVKDVLTGEPVVGVTISTNPASTVVITDADGKFSIASVPVGDIILSAKKLYYKTYSATINIQPESVNEISILMEKSEGYDLPSGNFVNPKPANGSNGIELTDTLRWQLITNAETDSIKFDFFLFETPDTNPVFQLEQVSDTFAIVRNLKYNKTYYWQVAASSKDSLFAYSKLWNFTTVDFPRLPFLFARTTNGIIDIYGMDSSKQIVIKLTGGQANLNWNPRYNPVTGAIAFVSNRQFNMQLYTMDNKGDDIFKVTTLNVTGNYNNGTGFCWSPDGSKLLYPHYNKLYSINKDGTGLTLIATAPEGRHFKSCDWSNYTNRIVVATVGDNPYENEIYLLNENGTGMTLLVEDQPGIIENPIFSIDGQKIMYTRDADGLNSWDGRQLNSKIYLYTLADSSTVDLSINKEDGTNDLMPRFSPDGASIIFVNTSNIAGSKHSIYISDTDGNNRQLLEDDATMPEWGSR